MHKANRGDDRCGFLTILDNNLAVSELTEGKDRAGRPHPHPGELLEGSGGGVRNRTAAEIAKVLWWLYEPCEKCVKIANCHIMGVLCFS